MTEKEKRETRTIQVAAHLHKGLKLAAVEDDRTITEIVEEIIERYLEQRKC